MLPISALEAIFKLGKPVVYESDDLLNEIPHDHPEAAAGASFSVTSSVKLTSTSTGGSAAVLSAPPEREAAER